MMMTVYVWANGLDKAIIELSRGNYFYSKDNAKDHRHSVNCLLWTIRFEGEKYASS